MYKVPLASNGLSEEAIEAAYQVLKSGSLTMGGKVRSFETEMARYLGKKHFVMMNSGSSANLLMVEALMRPSNSRPFLQAGDVVAVPAIAWPTTVWPLIQLGLRPLFVDVNSSNIGIDLDKLTALLESGEQNIKGVFAINALGSPLDELRLQSLSRRFGLSVILDNCESLGSHWNGRHSGAGASLASYSFYFSHHMTTMEGGGVATDEDELADDLRSMRSHGWSRDRSDADFWASMGRPEDNKFLFVTTGYNVRPMEVQAAIGLTELPQLEGFIQRRRAIADKVREVLDGSPLQLIGRDYESRNPGSRHSWMMLPILISKTSAMSRSDAIALLNSLGIETRPILTGNFLRQPAVRRLFPQLQQPSDFDVAEEISNHGFMLGCHQDFTLHQVEALVSALSELAKACQKA